MDHTAPGPIFCPPESPRAHLNDEAVAAPPVNLSMAEQLSVRELLAAYALLSGRKVALPHVAALREAFPVLFRSRPRWGAEAWDACDEACLDAIRTLLRQRGRLHLVASFDEAGA
jgi:hypothetical protein